MRSEYDDMMSKLEPIKEDKNGNGLYVKLASDNEWIAVRGISNATFIKDSEEYYTQAIDGWDIK